jgi:hypothetical protein
MLNVKLVLNYCAWIEAFMPGVNVPVRVVVENAAMHLRILCF